MAELSNAASIIDMLQHSSVVIDYINRVKGANKQRAALRGEVKACGEILQQLKDEIDDDSE